MKNKIFLLALIGVFLLSGCARIQPVLFLRPADLLLWPLAYMLVTYAMAFILSFDNNKKFWGYFLLNLILTPLTGICIILYKFRNS